MKKDLTEVVFILDKSGSMSGLEKDTIGGFNSLIEKQRKEPGEAIVSTVLFSDNSTVIHNRVNIKKIPLLTSKEYYVSGCTALLDAVGNAINYINKKHSETKEDEIPEKTLFIITTDGQENSSREFTYTKIKNLIENMKEKNKWEFIFLGANIDTVTEARKFGIDEDNAVSYNCDEIGIKLNYDSLGEAISKVRKDKCLSKSWRMRIDKDVNVRKKE